MPRGSASSGERDAAEWAVARLRECGVDDAHVERFRYQGTYGWIHALISAAGLRGGVASLAALAALELEASGRWQGLRRLLPASDAFSAVGTVGEGDRDLILVAHIDTARTGVAWHPRLVNAGARRRLERRRMDPFMAPTALGLALAALPARRARRLGRALVGASIAADLDIARSEHVPGASDNATGVAGVLALAEDLAASPPPGVRVTFLLCGCEESGMGGMAAWLRTNRESLDPARTLVLGLDTLGAGMPIVCSGEGTILEHRYGEAELDLADEGARGAGVAEPQRWRIGGWTDPILARHAGLPAISLLSVGPNGIFTNYHVPSDRPEHVNWESVDHCLAIARGTITHWSLQAG